MGCGASSSSAAGDPNAPIGLKHFHVERVIGEGGFGKVKYVIKKDTKVGYAMKIQEKQAVCSKGMVKMVLQELQVLTVLSTVSPGGAKCHFVTNLVAAFHDVDNLYLVMDIALGGNLKYHLRNFPKGYPEGHARFYAAQMVDGLIHLHKNLIIFRDLKPENLLLKADGYIMLSDFGISELLKSPDETIRSKSGTRAYIPPEALEGKPFSFDFDHFSLGVTVLELLIARLPSSPKQYGHQAIAKSAAASDFVNQLVAPAETRLGKHGTEEAHAHEWFSGYDWDALRSRTLTAPFIPNTKVVNFDAHEDDIMAALASRKTSLGTTSSRQSSGAPTPEISARSGMGERLFEDFSYTSEEMGGPPQPRPQLVAS